MIDKSVTVLTVPPGVKISDEDRAKLNDAGVVLISVDPEHAHLVRMVTPDAQASGGDLLLAAMRALRQASSQGSAYAATNFGLALASIIEQNAKNKP